MGLFSSSKSSTTNLTETQNTGFSDISGQALALQGEGNVVTFTDQGAVKFAGQVADRSFDAIEQSAKLSADSVSEAVSAVAESAREESENIIGNFKTLAIVGIIAYAAVSFGKVLK